jgi:hypothetical protein
VGDLKLIHFFETGNDELYDLATDPPESHNLAATRAESAADLRARLFEILASSKARLPVRKP